MIKLPDQFVLASHNAGKLREFTALFAPHNITVRGAAEFDISEPEETGTSFTANALLKARHSVQATGLAALADDSGLCVEAMNGDPGIYSARWAGPDKDFTMAMNKILDALKGTDNRNAAFVAVLALVTPDGEEITAEGRINGVIAESIRGDAGFGYDPIFIPEGEDRSFGDMTILEKQAHNHRARAFDALIKQLI